jgi:drug/metabolite transporter (DMT)-like permease
MALVLGITLALCGGATLALAMVTQRYALDPLAGGGDPKKIPLFGVMWSRHLVWFSGLVLYGGANGFYAMSLLYGPLSLLAGVFTTLLIFNLLFARLLLGEVLTFHKVVGAIFILCGVIMCIIATPRGTETEFTPSDIERLIERPAGFLYVAGLFR